LTVDEQSGNVLRTEAYVIIDGLPSIDRGSSFEGWSIENVSKSARHVSEMCVEIVGIVSKP
jgi:hypothetical protein